MGKHLIWTGSDGPNVFQGPSNHKSEAFGLGGDDTLSGADLSDTLVGGSGQDTLIGHQGHDHFVYQSVSDSSSTTPDLIADLSNGDAIDLHQIDADTTTDGDQAFHIVSAFSGLPGELVLTWDKASHSTLIEGDVDGDGHADLVIRAPGHHVDFTHFVL